MKKRCQAETHRADDGGFAVSIFPCTRPEDHGGEHVHADSGSGPFPEWSRYGDGVSVLERAVSPTVWARW